MFSAIVGAMRVRIKQTLLLSMLAVAALPATAQAPVVQPGDLAAERALSPGSWTITFDDGTSRRMCLQDIEPLIQLAHAGPTCGRFVIKDESDRATVHYTCQGSGWGRTTILVETPRLARINSQGISGRAPFAFDAEARRTGECDAPPVRHRH